MLSGNIHQQAGSDIPRLVYPTAHLDTSKTDIFHGISIANPYAWLEDPDAVDTKEFVRQQNKISEPIIHGHPVREKFKKRLTELWDYPKYGTPFRKGSNYFYYYNSGLQNQSVLYVQSSLTSEADVFLDPNTFDENGLKSISGVSFTEDGSCCAYGVSDKGSDWLCIKFMEVATKKHLPDLLENVKFSCKEWTHDNKGIFYNKYAKDDKNKQDGTETSSNLNQKLYYHLIGESQGQDILVAEFPDNPKWMVHASMCDDGRYVLLNVSEGCDPVNRLYVCDLDAVERKISGLLPYKKVVDNFEAEYQFIANDGDRFVFKTNKDSPRYKLITINMKTLDSATLVEEHERDVLEWAACVNNNTLVLCYLKDVKTKLFLHHMEDGSRYKELQLDIGSVVGYSGEKKHQEMFYKFEAFLSPGVIYHLDFTDAILESKIFRETKVKGIDASLFETKQLFYKSKDGTDIPMFIIHKKGISLDGNHPCLLYGYGGFSISITPSFNVSRTMFIQNLGGILAIANLRGGGEYGETWHKDGCFDKKQNVFDDFIAAGEYLLAEKYTTTERLAINGGSNGGLLVMACMNQRPDLFKCVVAQVAVCDMLNFHKYTIGHAWTTDFGCSDKKEDFESLIKYSPVHNVRVASSQYPAVLLLTADHDDRVVPLHSFKMIATLQHTLATDEKQLNPLLIKIDTESGHGYGKPTSKRIDEAADMYSFISMMVKASWVD